MIDFKVDEVGYRGRLVADLETGMIGYIRDKYYSGLYEVMFERDQHDLDLAFLYAETTDPSYLDWMIEYPNRAFRKAEQLELID